MDREDTLNKQRQAALTVHFRENGRIYNSGYAGIAQRIGETYVFSMFAKAEVPVELIISVSEGDRNFAAVRLTISGNEYKFYKAELIASADTRNAKFEICCPSGGRIKIGFVFLDAGRYLYGTRIEKGHCSEAKGYEPQVLSLSGWLHCRGLQSINCDEIS